MNKKKVIITAFIIVETVLLFLAFSGYMHMKNSFKEAMKINQELLDSYAKHNEIYHCNLNYGH